MASKPGPQALDPAPSTCGPPHPPGPQPSQHGGQQTRTSSPGSCSHNLRSSSSTRTPKPRTPSPHLRSSSSTRTRLRKYRTLNLLCTSLYVGVKSYGDRYSLAGAEAGGQVSYKPRRTIDTRTGHQGSRRKGSEHEQPRHCLYPPPAHPGPVLQPACMLQPARRLATAGLPTYYSLPAYLSYALPTCPPARP